MDCVRCVLLYYEVNVMCNEFVVVVVVAIVVVVAAATVAAATAVLNSLLW